MSEKVIAFKCDHCREPLQAPAADIGAQKECPSCGYWCEVLPPATIDRDGLQKDRNNRRGLGPELRDGDGRAGGEDSPSVDPKPAPVPKPESPPEPEPEPPPSPNWLERIKANAVYAAVVLSIAIVGYLGVVYGPEVVNSDGSVTVYTEDKTQLTIDNESVLRLIDHWQRARFARQQIEEDLKVTAEEMKTAGMSEELAIIEAAIEKKQQKIIEAKDLFVRQAVELRQAYQAAPSAYTQLIENVLDTQRVRNDPSRTTLITSVDHVIREEAGTGGSFEKGISKTFDNSLTT